MNGAGLNKGKNVVCPYCKGSIGIHRIHGNRFRCESFRAEGYSLFAH